MTLLLIITAEALHAISLPTLDACLQLGSMFTGHARVFCVAPGVWV